MSEEKKVITLSEFKTVIESVNSNIKKLGEAVQHNQVKTEKRFDQLEGCMGKMENRIDRMNGKIHSMDGKFQSIHEQIALLHEGQTEIKGMLNEKVDRGEFIKLEKRVGRLERKRA